MESDMEPTKSHYGTLSVRVGFWHGQLSVEVIAADNLCPVGDTFDIWHFCRKKEPNNDSFVEIELQPDRLFSNVS